METRRGAAVAETGENRDWMSQLSEELLDIPLWDLAIPGSHDTMSYCLDTHSPVLSSESCVLRLLDRLAPCITRTCVFRWATTQAWNVSDQLDAGIRFFDLRIAHKTRSKTDTLYFAHGIFTLLTVKETLSDIAVWLEQHPKEVVILVCSHFYEMSDSDHDSLISFITARFGAKLCPPQGTPSLSRCWGLGQQVIVSYDKTFVPRHEQLWPMMSYRYADSADPSDVISYLEHQKEMGRPAEFFASGLNLTEDFAFVVCHPCSTMRRMTRRASSTLLRWVEGQTPGPDTTSLNIICSDFVGLNDFASVVIGLNKKLLRGENQG